MEEVEHAGHRYKIKKKDVEAICQQYQLIINEDDSVGQHWVLMAVIQKAGISIRSTVDAMKIAAKLY